MNMIDPPFEENYKVLFQNSSIEEDDLMMMGEECELPLIDMESLLTNDQNSLKEIREAAREWGFFQLKNHGISQEVLETMQSQQKNVFYEPFTSKSKAGFLNLSPNSYRWGNSKATSLKQFSWSEAFHISFSDISKMHPFGRLRSTIEEFGEKGSVIAQQLAEILAKNLGIESNFFKENCKPSDGYVRINRYPKCDSPFSSKIYGLVPHVDSGFLTILYQDQIGGLQLKKDGKWRTISPDPNVLIVNTGDLFQAITNDVYKSVQHRVVVPKNVDRFSVAYFYCPSQDVAIRSRTSEPSLYRKFCFRDTNRKFRRISMLLGIKLAFRGFFYNCI